MEEKKKELSWIEDDAAEIVYNVMDANTPLDKEYLAEMSTEELLEWCRDQAMLDSPEASDSVISVAAVNICNTIRDMLSEETEQ